MNKRKGRPSRIFEKERVEEFLQLIQDGVDFNIAADTSKLARSTVFEWLKKGREIQESTSSIEQLEETEFEYLDFLERFLRARVAPEVKAVEVISKSIEKGSWRAAAWFLENRFPERWSENQGSKKQKTTLQESNQINEKELEMKVHSMLKAMRAHVE